MQQRIRASMASDEIGFLSGIVEIDECYVGGKPRKGNKHDDDESGTSKRRTKKIPVIGAVERNGKVVAPRRR